MNHFEHYDKILGDLASKTVKHKTVAERAEDYEQPYIAIRHHATVVVKLFPNGDFQLFSGGYKTATTKRRLSDFVPITQKDFTWYVFGKIEFYEGIKFNEHGEIVS